MTKMNYGPRFRSGVADVSHRYDPAMDSKTWKGWKPRQPKAGTTLAEIKRGKADGTRHNNSAGISLAGKPAEAKNAKAKEQYETAHVQAEKMVRNAIEILKLALDLIRETPKPPGQCDEKLRLKHIQDCVLALEKRAFVGFWNSSGTRV